MISSLRKPLLGNDHDISNDTSTAASQQLHSITTVRYNNNGRPREINSRNGYSKRCCVYVVCTEAIQQGLTAILERSPM
jgi:hypothetical protein